MDFDDLLKLALSIFLVLSGCAVSYLFLRMAGVFANVASSVTRVTDEVVPILSKAQVTMDGVNREIDRIDDIMVTAVNTTKGAERAVGTVNAALSKPIRKLNSVAAALREALAVFRARRAADTADADGSGPASTAPPKAGKQHESPY